MKSVKIVTYCTSSSIGSVLQAFALKRVLLDMGCESKILLEYEKKSKRNNLNPKQLCKDIFKMMHKKIHAGIRKRRKFISEHIDTVYYKGYQSLKEFSDCDEVNCYLAGSDQIWNPLKCNPVFFLDFVKDKKCISYAASMGTTVIHDEKREEFGRLLGNFALLSVREHECADLIGELTGQTADVHIDPTFLMCAEEWRTYETPYKVKEPYILLYMIYWDSSLTEKVKYLAKRTGLKVYTIKNGLSRAYGDKMLYDVGVDEFLWLIDHAEYVVTSSFHGVAMSVIFNKKFSAVINPASPSRIDNLLRVLSIPRVDINDLDFADNFDYVAINQRILEERARGTEYLREALK